MMKRVKGCIIVVIVSLTMSAQGQDAVELVKKVRARLEQVSDYKAAGRLKTDVSFIKVPESEVQIYYKKPDRFKIHKQGGISILPKGGVSFNMNSMLASGQYTVVPAGETTIGQYKLTIVKLLPLQESSQIVLTTLYIDAPQQLIRKASTTTKDNGTYEMQLQYGKYAKYGLPDKVTFSFNTREYKLPKGVTLEYDNNEKKAAPKSNKGIIELTYSNYVINKGVPEGVFK